MTTSSTSAASVADGTGNPARSIARWNSSLKRQERTARGVGEPSGTAPIRSKASITEYAT